MHATQLDVTATQALFAAAAAGLVFTVLTYFFRRRLALWCLLIATAFALAGTISLWRN